MMRSAVADLEETLQRLNSSRRSNSRSGGFSSMSAGLSSPSTDHGVHTIPKGDCAGCGQPIIGQIVIAMGRSWHPEHYTCSHCGQELGRQPYFERGGKAFCENDYFELFSPRCAYCNGPIRDRCVHALNKTFHLEHFNCVECGQRFGPEGFHEKDGMPYCRTDYLRLFGPKCKGCNNPVKNRFITALGATWDPECFVCTDCSRPFNDGVFFTMSGSPLCETHYHERRGSVCAQCHKPFTEDEVAKHNNRESAWVIIKNKVYDVTTFLNEHPGGDLLLLDRAGKDATIEFVGQEHSTDAKEILRFCPKLQTRSTNMGRMHNPGKGISRSALPYRRSVPNWLKLTSTDVEEQIERLARKGLRPSQIGVVLRDSHGVAQVRRVTGNKIVRILKKKGMAPEIPEDLYHLIKKAVNIRKHLERSRKDIDSKYRLILVESRIHRLARYYKTKQQLPSTWKYESATASALVS